MSRLQNLLHPRVTRRTAVQAGAIGMLGLGSNHRQALQAADVKAPSTATAKCCIYIFLSGGLSQHDSFDPKPDAPSEVRGEFSSIPTQTVGLDICEHLLSNEGQVAAAHRSSFERPAGRSAGVGSAGVGSAGFDSDCDGQ